LCGHAGADASVDQAVKLSIKLLLLSGSAFVYARGA